MAKQFSENEFDEILKIVRDSSTGISLGNIHRLLTDSISSRQVQYKLGILVKKGRLLAIGNARARIYKTPLEEKQIEAISKKTQKESIIPLSPIAEEIQNKVTEPITKRTPVGYNRTFLDSYRPNVTHYLPKEIQLRFMELGKTDGERPAGTYAREILNRLLIELSWNSSRLEGNTYSILETERLIELSEAAEGKNFEETQMILNHKATIEFLVESVEVVDINRQTILNVHALLSDNLLPDPNSCGRIRKKSIGIAKSVYHPLGIPDIINECFEQIVDTAKAILNPFEQAFFLMVHLPYLQPFEDVNKRVSRLVSNIPFIRLNLAPLSFMDVPRKTYINALLAVYELNRIELLLDVFIWAYERSCALYSATRQTLGQPDAFRLRYRNIILDTVSHVVKEKLDKKQAVTVIKSTAIQSLPLDDQQTFIEKVEIELRSLHEGNIARFKIKPLEYDAWAKTWH